MVTGGGGGGRGIWVVEAYRGMSADNIKGLVLALSSSFFIGASFIVKKKGLKKAGASGVRAGRGKIPPFRISRSRTFEFLVHFLVANFLFLLLFFLRCNVVISTCRAVGCYFWRNTCVPSHFTMSSRPKINQIELVTKPSQIFKQ